MSLLIGLLGLSALVAILIARRRRITQTLLRRLQAAPPTTSGRPPESLARVARANGAGQDGPWRILRLEQVAQFRFGPGKPWIPMPAVQHVALGMPGFVWEARRPGRLGPLLTVVDAFVMGKGRLSATVLGVVPVADRTGPVMDRAEAMRYLAELPWAPDAILGNPHILWHDAGDGWIEATLPIVPLPVTVRLRMDTDGDIVEIAADRPDTAADGSEMTRSWCGRFTEYGQIGGRRIPLAGEVGYVDDDGYQPYWRGRITAYRLMR